MRKSDSDQYDKKPFEVHELQFEGNLGEFGHHGESLIAMKSKMVDTSKRLKSG